VAVSHEQHRIRQLEVELGIAQHNFRVTNAAYVQLDAQLRQRGGLIGWLVRKWVSRTLRNTLKRLDPL
jgi:hypothetical protein